MAKAGGENGAKVGRTRVSRGAVPHHDAALATDLARNAHSRERYELVWRAMFVLIVAVAVSVVGNVYLGTRPPVVKTFAMTPGGSVKELETLSDPLQSDDTVLQWTATAVTKAFTMSFANQQQELADIRQYFTESGWKGYQDALTRSGFTDNLVKNQYVASAVPTGAPTVAASGRVPSGNFAWRVQMPLLVTYSSNTSNSQNLTVEVTVVRRSVAENATGLGIAQIVTQ